MIGKTISHYKILERLGGGGMGVVYKAEDTRLKRTVALKFLSPELLRDPDAKRRFNLEAQAASALQDSNIYTIHEIDETPDGQMFICMDYYHGETLKKIIERGPLKLDDAINFAIKIASGLATAHDAQLIHRDIKPANIMITDKGEIKIVDFGLAKLRGKTAITVEGTTLGTVAYMSPEQVRGELVDHRSDIWSLGALIYEMLSGQPPFKGEYDQAVFYAILNEDPPPLTALRTGLPMELERIVCKALNRNPAKRYQHTDELLGDLRQLHESLKTTDTSYLSTVIPQIKNHNPFFKKYLLPAVAILLLILAYFQLKTVFIGEVLAEPKPVVVISFKNLTGDKTYDYLQEAIPNLLITSLEQSKYLRVVSWERIYDVLKQLGKQDLGVIDQQTGFEICRLEGVEAIILGSYIKAGDIFATDVKVLDVRSKQLIKSASSRGEGVGSILQNQIDDLSREISQSVGISENVIKGTQLRISDVTTESMEAYHNFLKGQDAFEKMYYEDARTYLERAIQIDSTFAVAYLYLAWVNGQLLEDEIRDINYEKAKRYANRAGEKDHMYIEAFYAMRIEKNPEKHILILQQMAKKYPMEKLIFYNLGQYYSSKKEYQESITFYNQALELDPQYGSVFNDLAYVYGDMGEFDKAEDYLKKYSEALPGDANPYDSFGEFYLRTGQIEKAIEKYKEAIEVKPDFGSEARIASIYAFQEDYKTAIEWIDNYISKAKSPSVVVWGYWWKGYYSYLSGNPTQAWQFLDLCIERSRKIKSQFFEALTEVLKAWILLDQGKVEQGDAHYIKWYEYNIRNAPQYLANYKADLAFYRGLSYLKQLDHHSARVELNKIRLLFPEMTPLAQEKNLYNQNYLYSQILVATDSLSAAEKNNENLKPMETPFRFNLNYLFFNFPIIRDDLARAYQRQGLIDQAINVYEKLIELDPKKRERRFINPKYHYRLAKLYEEKGSKEKAIRQYKLFLNIWRNAEQNSAELTDAKSSLSKLTEN